MGKLRNTDHNDTQQAVMQPIADIQGLTIHWIHNDGRYQQITMWKLKFV